MKKLVILIIILMIFLIAGCTQQTDQPPSSEQQVGEEIGSEPTNIDIPQSMDYHDVYVFNCEPSQEFPIESDESTITLTGELISSSHFSRKSPYLSCNLVDDYILWDAEKDECLRDYDTLLYDRKKEFEGKKQVITIKGYYKGEFIPEEYEKFYLVDIPDYEYVCCNVCCNKESPLFQETKKCFWFKKGDEKPFPYPEMLIN
ncbi:hypothetical protein KY348_02970 [Candidatus Woesearchaeota archaeon]|nr:hypothetical protein [Candidatus Woesearchaeota archaeon]